MSDYTLPSLDSISFFPEDPALLQGPSLATLMPLDFGRYQLRDLRQDKELLAPRLWNLPEIFRKKLTAYSGHYLNEVILQNRITEMVRYNFSNGWQISAKEILRHPWYKAVPLELLPDARSAAPVFELWPLTPQGHHDFTSQATKEIEEIMQQLLVRVAAWHRQKKIDLYLQHRSRPQRAMKIESLEFDPSNEVDWRVDFDERDGLVAQYKLISFRKRDLSFYESFAVEPESGAVIVYPWLRELSRLQETLSSISLDLRLPAGKMPGAELVGEHDAKILLTYLRSRPIPVKITGESHTLSASQSQIEIRLDESGGFYVQHDARVPGQKNLLRRGWSERSTTYLRALSSGLPSVLGLEAREIASRSRGKRDWDLKLLKHLGILQYLFFEVLHLHFHGALSDGTDTKPEDLFQTLHPRLHSILTAGSGGSFVRDVPLTELCSKSVLACFDEFVDGVFESLRESGAFFSESGEVVLEGLVEREFRLLHTILQHTILATGGDLFRRTRTSLLGRIAPLAPEEGSLNHVIFRLPAGESTASLGLRGTLEVLQPLLHHGLKLFYQDQPLHELEEDEFHVDFILQSDDPDPKNFNWFELNPKFFLRGEEVDPNSFLSLGGGGVVEFENRMYLVSRQQMPSLRRLEIFWQKLQKGKAESPRRRLSENIYQLPRNQTLELLALRASGVRIRGDERWQELCRFYDELGGKPRELKLPPTVKAELKPYQETGVRWLQDLHRLRLGALLADDMGLGKTLQTLCFLEGLRQQDELGPTLIVVPSSLIFNWQSEIEKFTPQLPMTVFSAKDREKIGRRVGAGESFVTVITYSLLMEHDDFMGQFKWNILVFDEAQNLKNISTKRTSAARSMQASFKICLTGTPMENHYGEFYSLVDLLVPGSLGRLDDFRRQFVNTEMITREEMNDLKLKIRPLLLRRTKKEILDQLPEKQETKISIAFEERQKEIYRDIALAYNQRVQETMAAQGEASVQLQMLTALLRLRQACSDPGALPNVRYDKVPPKLETLMDSLREIVESGESALVFTQFLQTLEHAADLLRKEGMPVFVLHGGVPSKQRQKILTEFHAIPGGAVLLMTLKTGGVGLNLTKASYVFHLEPWWNPAVENQATDRAHRLGQSKAVQVFRYIMHESLEEKIEILKNRKDRKFQSLFSSTEKDVEVGMGGSSLSKEDFDLLLGL